MAGEDSECKISCLIWSIFLSILCSVNENMFEPWSNTVSDLRWEQVTLPQLIIQLNSLFKQWIFLLSQVGNLLADLLGVLSSAAMKETVPLTQFLLKWLNTSGKHHQVFTQGLTRRWIHSFSIWQVSVSLKLVLFCYYLTGAEPLGLQSTAFLQQSFFLGQDFLSFSQLSFQIFQSSSLFQYSLHFLIKPAFLFLNLLLRDNQGQRNM